MPVLQHTTASYGDVHQFMEDYLGNSYPYESYQQVFVDGCSPEGMAFAGLTIMDKSAMHDSSIIDDAYVTRLLQARLLGEQWFGCFTMPKAWADNWLRFGLSAHLMSIYAKKTFGGNETRYQNWVVSLPASAVET
jgi:transcription initiation factor TFIID subunit 2